MIKPIGPHLLIKIEKKPVTDSGIIMPDGVKGPEEMKAIVTEIGTDCRQGIKIGHEVLFKSGVQGVTLEQTDAYDMALIPEHHIAAVMNWDKKEDEKKDDLPMEKLKNLSDSAGKPTGIRVPNCT